MTIDPLEPPAATATWTWRYGDVEGRPVTEPVATMAIPAPGFAAQADAESWVGEHWGQLLSAGVDSVTLQYDGQVIYGPMSLHPAAN